jgi:hypothetical protein
MARRTPRLDRGRRGAWLLYARAVGVEPAPELLRRAVYLGTYLAAPPAWSFKLNVSQGVLNLIPLVSLRTSASEFVSSRDCTLTDALQTLVPLTPSLALCLLFLSSTQFTESISTSKYPRGYAAYCSRVAMFVPMLTPVWGALLRLTGGKAEVEELVWGKGAREAEAGNNKNKAEQKK